jgi:DNA polymerase-3 subunit beta
MFTFSFDIRALKATAINAGTEAIRYYLNGVCVEHTPDGPIFVATDGTRLIATRHDWGIDRATYFSPVIVPLSLIKRIKINRKIDEATMTIEPKEKGAIVISIYYAGATYIEDAIDGTFPDWRRVIPRECDGTLAQFNPDYLAAFADAGRVLGNGKCDVSVAISHNGGSPALVRFWHEDKPIKSFGVIMPMRTNHVMDAPPSWAGYVKPEPVATATSEGVEAAALKAVADALAD